MKDYCVHFKKKHTDYYKSDDLFRGDLHDDVCVKILAPICVDL